MSEKAYVPHMMASFHRVEDLPVRCEAKMNAALEQFMEQLEADESTALMWYADTSTYNYRPVSSFDAQQRQQMWRQPLNFN